MTDILPKEHFRNIKSDGLCGELGKSGNGSANHNQLAVIICSPFRLHAFERIIPGSSTLVSSTAISSTPILSTDVLSTQFFFSAFIILQILFALLVDDI